MDAEFSTTEQEMVIIIMSKSAAVVVFGAAGKMCVYYAHTDVIIKDC